MWINIVDLEATCWEGRPQDNQISEIIEIGLTEMNVFTGERRRAPRMLVRPTVSEISPFCNRLTGITTAQVQEALTFEELAPILRRQYQSDIRPWGSWGAYDQRMLTQQAERLSLHPVFSADHHNLKARYGRMARMGRPPGMMGALKAEGIAHEGLHHQGDDDSWNISAVAEAMRRRGWLPWPDVIS